MPLNCSFKWLILCSVYFSSIKSVCVPVYACANVSVSALNVNSQAGRTAVSCFGSERRDATLSCVMLSETELNV